MTILNYRIPYEPSELRPEWPSAWPAVRVDIWAVPDHGGWWVVIRPAQPTDGARDGRPGPRL